MFSLFTKSDEEVVVVFDIGSGSVGAALVTYDQVSTPTIHYTYREPLAFMNPVTPKRLLEAMTKLVGQVAEHVKKDGVAKLHKTLFGLPRVDAAYCIFSSPWFVSETKIIRQVKEKPVILNKKMIDDIIREEERAFDDALKEGKYERLFGTQIELLERKITHCRLNGYEVADPVGKQATEIELTLHISCIATSIVKEIEHTLHKSFRFKNQSYYSYALSAWNAVRTMFPSVDSFVFIDITGETTDLSIVQKGTLMETVSLSKGRGHVIRQVCQDLKIEPAVAVSSLAMAAQRMTDEKHTKKIDSAAAEAVKEWSEELIVALKDLEARYPLPKNVFLTADRDVSAYFLNELKRPLPAEFNINQNMFTITNLDSATMRRYVNYAPGAGHDPFVGIESIFLRSII